MKNPIKKMLKELFRLVDEEHKDQGLCLANELGYTCTRVKGHEGVHIAQSPMKVVSIWFNAGIIRGGPSKVQSLLDRMYTFIRAYNARCGQKGPSGWHCSLFPGHKGRHIAIGGQVDAMWPRRDDE